MDINDIVEDINKLATQVGQNQQVVQDLKSGAKKIAIVPGSGPSLVLSTAGTIAVGIPAMPILAVLVALMVFLSTRKR